MLLYLNVFINNDINNVYSYIINVYTVCIYSNNLKSSLEFHHDNNKFIASSTFKHFIVHVMFIVDSLY